jgi:uncharacterized OsmC-like protein
MRNQPERTFRVDLRHVEGYRFESLASEGDRVHGDPFASDEPDPVGAASAPATPALLGAAVGHCLAASLLESLRHAHVAVSDCTTEVTAVVRPNAAGLPRIDHVDVLLKPVVLGDATRTRRCEEVFERHCTVTSSVRTGIDVRVEVDWTVASEEEVRQPARAEAVAASGTE